MVDSMKNIALGASGDLGLAQQLQNQIDDQLDEQRKKKLLQQQQPNQYGDRALNPATMSLYGGMMGMPQ
jgi:hypothetical protein